MHVAAGCMVNKTVNNEEDDDQNGHQLRERKYFGWSISISIRIVKYIYSFIGKAHYSIVLYNIVVKLAYNQNVSGLINT